MAPGEQKHTMFSSGDIVVAKAIKTTDQSSTKQSSLKQPMDERKVESEDLWDPQYDVNSPLHRLPHELLWMIVDHLQDSSDIGHLSTAMVSSDYSMSTMFLRLWSLEQKMDRLDRECDLWYKGFDARIESLWSTVEEVKRI